MVKEKQRNPFTVQTPEDLNATEATELFVDVFSDFYKILAPGHSMLNGPRGSGKSMMFRFLEPDCQVIAKEKSSIAELEFFAVLVSVKNAMLNLTELRRLSGGHFNAVLNEHFLTVFVSSKVFDYSAGVGVDPTNEHLAEVNSFIRDVLITRLQLCGGSLDEPAIFNSTDEALKWISSVFDRLYQEVIQFVKRLSIPTSSNAKSFNGPLCGYLDFLHPILAEFKRLPFMPSGPIYLLMDDADVLNLPQTKVLNSWLGTRTHNDVSIKISTQQRYKSFSKVNGGVIETPHDFSEVNIADLYTTNKGKYLSRVKEIIKKRLESVGITESVNDFFPALQSQVDAIENIKEEIASGEHEVSGRGYRISDDKVRYATPLFIASLGGRRKSTSKYSYSGFEQLVHVSSGLIRYFLEPAALMFGEQQAISNGKTVESIAPRIQNDEIRKMSELAITSEFEKISSDEEEEEHIISELPFFRKKEKLRNLIDSLGGVFFQKLISDDAERRVFSVAVSSSPAKDVLEIFELGVKHGYFQRTTIGNKDGTGRTPLYVLTRRLAPYYGLDPSGFAGYLFVSNERLREAMEKPSSLLRRIKDKGIEEAFGEVQQLELFS